MYRSGQRCASSPVVYGTGAEVLRLRKVPVEDILLHGVHEAESGHAPELKQASMLQHKLAMNFIGSAQRVFVRQAH